MRLNLTADEVLTTTRSVRKRLDLDRPVEREIIEECLEIALQAPSGSNSQGWQFVFVEDPDTKKIIADHYGTNFDAYAERLDQPVYPDDDPRSAARPRVVDSARYLRENFHRVPVMLIPCIEATRGRLDEGIPTFGQASSWGSILPAVWSFMLALRERGLGSAWTTLHLPNEREVADLLGIPYDRVTQAGLFPIAYTRGTDFKVAERLPRVAGHALGPVVTLEPWELAAREQIRDLVARYNANGDSGRFAQVLELFAADATMDIDTGRIYRGHDEIGQIFTGTRDRAVPDDAPRYVRHFTATHQIDLTDRAHARGRCYFQVLTAVGLDHWGRYLDEYVFEVDRWRFASRRVVTDGFAPGSLFGSAG